MRPGFYHKGHQGHRGTISKSQQFESRSALFAVIVFAVTVSACSSPTATPPAVINTPPTIQSLTIASDRAEADRPIQVTAIITDVESTLERLTYTWSASPQIGTFNGTTAFAGNQAIMTWRPPKGQPSPAIYTVTLTVTESYTSAGQAKVNSVSSSATVHYNDSAAETTALGVQFIKDFGTFEVSPEQCVRNFSATGSCAGERAQELEDIRYNRANFHILSSVFPSPVATFNTTLTEGVVQGPCTFEDIPNPGQPNAGRREFVSGTCYLTTVYENFRWFLCRSNFFNGEVNLASVKGRVPGRVVTSIKGFE
jgi:hypothetical protein